jgi:Sap, sulfolipid-1-addressing protein
MRQVVGDLLPFAVPVALSPLPVIAVVMLLLAPAGIRGGLGFLAGRLVALAAATLLFATLADGLAAWTGSGAERGWLRIGLGLLLLAGAVPLLRQARRREVATVPGWLRSIDRASPAGAMRLGAVLTVANLKELAFAAGAGLLVGGAGLGTGAEIAAAVGFALLAGLGVAVPILAAILAGDAARTRLRVARDWLLGNQAIVLAVVLVLVGAMLVGSGIAAL